MSDSKMLPKISKENDFQLQFHNYIIHFYLQEYKGHREF